MYRMSKTNDYIYTEAYRKFLNLLMQASKEKENREVDVIVKGITDILSGKDIKACILSLSFMISNVFTVDEPLFTALEETKNITDIIQQKHQEIHSINPSYV